VSNNNTTTNNNGSILTMGTGKMRLGSQYNTPRRGVVGLPGDEGDDHDDDGGREGAEGMVVELESKPKLERGRRLIGKGG